ncbi:MAG: hypothetical protein LBQ02_04475 [Candidatus Nomurabacteria bacterium]|nr:hypothetical protein [Candidatus Nomurabacteria bacterium]
MIWEQLRADLAVGAGQAAGRLGAAAQEVESVEAAATGWLAQVDYWLPVVLRRGLALGS